MEKKTSITPSVIDSSYQTSGQRYVAPQENLKPSKLWLSVVGLLIIGLIILSGVSYFTWNWLRNVQVVLGSSPNTGLSITTLNVQRTVTYADLNFTVLSAQYALSFPDDTIQTGPAVVRLNMHVTNKMTAQIAVVYYDIARLIAPELNPIAPTNVHLSAGPKPGSSETGWIDFPVNKGIQLATLKLQMGSVPLGETLVTIPFSGTFDPHHFDRRISPQSMVIYYDFKGNTLVYHLANVDIRYSYAGTECKAGNQFYVLNFTVDNDNGVAVSPGFGYDYIRLVVNGYNRPPIDNTLPYSFNAGVHGVGGRVAYVAPAGLQTLTITFLLQVVQGQDPYSINL
jgi:hypothetical protein